jgi:hypothetical protein
MWFFSGMVMMYVPFPSVSDKERLTFLPEINMQRLTLAPAEALAECGLASVTGMRLISINSRPAYVCDLKRPVEKIIYADNGAPGLALREDDIGQLIRRNLEERIENVTKIEYDQWTVHQRFDAYRPLYLIELADPEGTNLYLSSITGEFLQRTTSSQRFWNYIGSVPHWIYPTVLRKNWAIWDGAVWWLSLFAIVCAVIGFFLGLAHWLKARRRGLISAFHGWMKWHHIIGLFAGLLIVSWVFSGWLSMDHGRIFSMPNPTAEQIRALNGGSFGEIGSTMSRENLAKHSLAKELTLHAFGGQALLVARNEREVIAAPVLKPSAVAGVVSRSFPDFSVESWSVVAANDLYTNLREGSLPPDTIRVEMSDPSQTWIHLDNRSGEILSVIDRSRRLYRWLYNGLHSFDIPGIADNGPLREILMLALLMGGFAASITGVVLGIRRAFNRSLR